MVLLVSFLKLIQLLHFTNEYFPDNLTSSLSTFPYDAAATEKFLDLLTASRGRIHEGYTVAFVARLWGLISMFHSLSLETQC